MWRGFWLLSAGRLFCTGRKHAGFDINFFGKLYRNILMRAVVVLLRFMALPRGRLFLDQFGSYIITRHRVRVHRITTFDAHQVIPPYQHYRRYLKRW